MHFKSYDSYLAWKHYGFAHNIFQHSPHTTSEYVGNVKVHAPGKNLKPGLKKKYGKNWRKKISKK
jgi:hypothetical protein